MGVREWVEEKYDRVKRAVKRPVERYSYNRERESQDSAGREYYEKKFKIHEKKRRGEISQELADKWTARAEERRTRKSVPFGKRAGRVAARAIVGAADRAYNPAGRATRDVWGVSGWTDSSRPRYSQRYTSGRRATYSMLSGSSRSYNTAKKQFKSQRSPQQYGSFLVTGSHTGKSKASGWGILYGKRAKTNMWGVEKSEKRTGRGRRSSRRDRDSGAGRWVGLL